MRVPLNPMSVTLGALVIAISTEFSVLLSRALPPGADAGLPVAEALARTYRSTGAAVLASGATAIAGFAVLVVSDIRMLRDFGFVTVVDLAVSLLGVLVVLPAVLVLAERGELLSLPAQAWRARAGRCPGACGAAAPARGPHMSERERGPLDFDPDEPAPPTTAAAGRGARARARASRRPPPRRGRAATAGWSA